jgi:hypothetical protein
MGVFFPRPRPGRTRARRPETTFWNDAPARRYRNFISKFFLCGERLDF